MKLPFSAPRPQVRRFPTAGEFGFVEVRGGTSRIVCVPALGGRIVDMEIGGRQWLWKSDIIPFGPPQEGTNYGETADSGGFDECFPTVGACRIPGWVRGWGGVELPDHGEVWSQVPEMDIDTTEDGQAVVTTWEGRRLPYRLTRLARVTRTGAVVMTYHAVNDSADRMPFIWSAHPLLPLSADTKLMLPEGSPMKVAVAHKLVMGDSRSQHRWPFVRAGGRVLDFLTPFEVTKEYACKLFLEPSVGKAAVRQGQDELEVSFDLKEIPHLGVWINKQGWTPFKKEPPYLNLVVAPCLGAPDTLSEALGDWKKAQWLEPGEVRSWSITWTARRVPDEAEAPQS